MKPLLRSLLCLGLLGASALAQAFDLNDLRKQLSEPEVIKGEFVQEKHLRALGLGAAYLLINRFAPWMLRDALALAHQLAAHW